IWLGITSPSLQCQIFSSVSSTSQIRTIDGPCDFRYFRHLTTVIFADFRLDERFELVAHRSDQVRVFLTVERKVFRFRSIRLEIEQFHIVRLVEVREIAGLIAIDWGEIAGELVAAVEYGPNAATLLQVRREPTRLHGLPGVLAGSKCFSRHLKQAGVLGQQGAV